MSKKDVENEYMNDYPHVCANCKWWLPFTDSTGLGECHRYPREDMHSSGYWCGEFAVTNPNVRAIRYDVPYADYQYVREVDE